MKGIFIVGVIHSNLCQEIVQCVPFYIWLLFATLYIKPMNDSEIYFLYQPSVNSVRSLKH